MTHQAGSPDPRRGILGRVTEAVYRYLIVELAFLLAALPGFVGILLLDRSASNIPLYALCLIPVAPAFSAAVATVADRGGETGAWPRFWRAYRANVGDILRVWVPTLVALTVLGMNVAFGSAAGVDVFFIGASIVLLIALIVWSANAILIASIFRFRARDIARLALYYLAAKPLVTLGTAGYLAMAAAVVTFTSDWVLALLGVFFATFAVVVARPMTLDITERFVAGGDPEPPPV